MNTEKLKRHLSIFTILSLFLAFVFSCSIKTPPKAFKVRIATPNKSISIYTIECDSFNMKSLTEIDVWIDGRKSTVLSNEITPYTDAY
jgi:hypothetical protein